MAYVGPFSFTSFCLHNYIAIKAWTQDGDMVSTCGTSVMTNYIAQSTVSRILTGKIAMPREMYACYTTHDEM